MSEVSVVSDGLVVTPGQSAVNGYSTADGNQIYIVNQSNVIVGGPVSVSAIANWANASVFQFEVASTVVQSLRRKGEYMDLYVDYLQGALEKEQFQKASDALTVVPQHLDSSEVLRRCLIAQKLTGEAQVDSAELGLMLDLDPFDVENALRDAKKAADQIGIPNRG